MVDMHIPPLRAVGIDIKEIEERRKELRDLGRDLAMIEAELTVLESRKAQAQRLDAEAGARSRRAGQRDLGPQHTAKLEEELQAARRERDILAVAIEQAEAEISSYMAENAARLIQELLDQEGELNRVQLSAVDAVEEARSRRFSLAQAARWCSQFIPPEAEGEDLPPADGVEVIDPHAHARSRPSDLEIAKILRFLKTEAGADAEVIAEAKDFSITIDGRASLAHSFDRRIAAFEAEKALAGGDDAA